MGRPPPLLVLSHETAADRFSSHTNQRRTMTAAAAAAYWPAPRLRSTGATPGCWSSTVSSHRRLPPAEVDAGGLAATWRRRTRTIRQCFYPPPAPARTWFITYPTDPPSPDFLVCDWRGTLLKFQACYLRTGAMKAFNDLRLPSVIKSVTSEACQSLKRRRDMFAGLKLKEEILLCLVDQLIHTSENVDIDDLIKDLHPKALRVDPSGCQMLAKRSRCWLRLGDGQKALEDATICKKSWPGPAEAHHCRAEALMLLKEYEKACEELSSGLDLDL